VQVVVSGILFDLDGTLLDTSGPIGRSWIQWAGEHGITAADFQRVGSHGRRSVDLVNDLVEAGRAGAATRRIHALELADMAGIVAIAGAEQLLRSLPADRWGIVTSGDRSLATARLQASSLGFATDRLLVTGDEVGAGKPDPGPYTAGAAALGLPPQQCLVIEDAPAGVVSGRAAGARTLALTTTVEPEQIGDADFVVADLSSVRVLSVAVGIVLEVDLEPASRPAPAHSLGDQPHPAQQASKGARP